MRLQAWRPVRPASCTGRYLRRVTALLGRRLMPERRELAIAVDEVNSKLTVLPDNSPFNVAGPGRDDVQVRGQSGREGGIQNVPTSPNRGSGDVGKQEGPAAAGGNDWRNCSSCYFLNLAACRSLACRERFFGKRPLPIRNSRTAAWTTAVSDGFASWARM